jgi:hypothetical protein
MRNGCLGDTTAMIAMVLLVGVAVIGIGAIGSSPNIGANGLTWDHTGRIAWEESYTQRDATRQREQTAREVAKHAAETQRAQDWNDTLRVLILGGVVVGGVWIATREMGATVRNRDDKRATVAMYQIYMAQHYPNARIETRNNQQLVVDPDSRTVFPLAVLKVEARQAGYEEI